MHYWINSETIHALWVKLWVVFMYFCATILAFLELLSTQRL